MEDVARIICTYEFRVFVHLYNRQAPVAVRPTRDHSKLGDTLFANASTLGTSPVRALFFEFPNEPELFNSGAVGISGKSDKAG